MTSKLYEIKCTATNNNFEQVKIKDPEEAYEVISKFYHDDIRLYESFFILCLNAQKKTIGYAKISQGGVSATVVDPVIIAKFAIDLLAHSVILAHNHPSGALETSLADKRITDKLKKGLEFINIRVEDHIILVPPVEGQQNFYSMARNNEL
jgi:DNA repair protein RadC